MSTKAEAFAQLTIENKEVSPGKSLTLDISPCGKSLIEIRKIKGPNTEPCRIPAFKNFQLEDYDRFKQLCDVNYGEMTQLDQKDYYFLHCFLLYRRPSCQTLSNVFAKSNKTPQTSN